MKLFFFIHLEANQSSINFLKLLTKINELSTLFSFYPIQTNHFGTKRV